MKAGQTVVEDEVKRKRHTFHPHTNEEEDNNSEQKQNNQLVACINFICFTKKSKDYGKKTSCCYYKEFNSRLSKEGGMGFILLVSLESCFHFQFVKFDL